MLLTEVFVIGSTVLIGAILGHYTLLSISRRLKNTSPNAVALQRLQTLQTLYAPDDTVSSGCSATSVEKPSLRRSTTASRGIIAALPNRHLLFIKSPWPRKVRESAINKLIVSTHGDNPRSTYLGADTFNKLNPSAQLFGWERRPGQPTIELGDIGQLMRIGDETGLCVTVHPDDAEVIIDAAWGTLIDSNHKQRSIKPRKGGVTVLLRAPESQVELDQVTKVVLDAAIWYVAGLDREQTV